MVALFARKSGTTGQDGRRSYALHGCGLLCRTTLWTEGCRVCLLDLDVALDDSGHRLGGPWYGHFCQGYFDGCEVALGLVHCGRTARLRNTSLLRPVDVGFT